MIRRWRQIAMVTISSAIKKAQAENLDIKKTIDAAYPFGERAYHPYRIWLSQRRIALEHFNLYHKKYPTDSSRFTCKYCRDLEGGCLFCMNRQPQEGDVVLSQTRKPRPYDVVLGGKNA